MTVAVSALYDRRAKVPNLPAEAEFCDCELTSDEFSRLLGEIDSLQLAGLLAPFQFDDQSKRIGRPSW